MSFSHSFVTLGKIREDPSALPHIPCSPCCTGFEIPVPFLDCGNKDIHIGLHQRALKHLVERPFSKGVRTLKVTEGSKYRTFLS
jgi:hypothetical protein